MTGTPTSLTGVIATRYEIERELGRGGMATVYIARDLRHGSRVAVKVLSPLVASQLGLERFTREIRITAGLQHPNIVPVFDSGVVNGMPFYVMPYVEGRTLDERLRDEQQLPVDDALEIACEIADALAHAHSQGFVHRDIKPSNILLAHGHVMLADFGIARILGPTTGGEHLTSGGIAVGTVAYMSPEQASGEPVDGRSDIYSLGCVLYEMLAGLPPFTGSTPRAVMARHISDAPPSLHTVRSTVPPTVEAVIRKMLAKSRADRYDTAAEVERAIRDAMKSDSTVVAAPRRSRAPVFAAIVGVVVLAIVGVALWMRRDNEVPLDRNRVMIYPLVVPPRYKASPSLGEDVATMIGNALDGTGPLRWIDSWPHLDAESRKDIRTLSGAEARNLARSKRCAYYVTGRLLDRGDSAEVVLELNDVAGDSTIARGNAIGPASSAWRVGLLAVNDVLPRLIPSGAPDIEAEWRNRDPSAVASFLLGEAAFRRLRIQEALSNYREAVRRDPSFSLAAIRGSQVATWNHQPAEAESLIVVALRQPLPPRFVHFARGVQAYLRGYADSSATEFRSTVAIDPEMSAAWMQLGEVYTHLLPDAGEPDALAEAAFDRARQLDPAASNILYHPIEILLRRGEAANAEPLLRRFLASNPDSLLAEQLRVTYDCVRLGPRRVDWRIAVSTYPLAVLGAANSLKGGGAQLECAMSAYEAVLAGDTLDKNYSAGRRWYSLVGIEGVLLARGKVSQAIARLDSSIAASGTGSSLYLMTGAIIPALRDKGARVAAEDALKYGRFYERCPWTQRLWQLGVLEAARGNRGATAAISRELADRARRSGLRDDALFVRSMEARQAVSAGDTVRAMAMLDAIIREDAPSSSLLWDLIAPRGTDRLLLSQLLLVRGRYRRALDVASVFDASWPAVYLFYVPQSLEVRERAATALGDAALAASYRHRLAALRGG